MKIKVTGNLVTFVTDIPAEFKDEKLVAKNDKGDIVYSVSFGTDPVISKFCLICNTIIDGKMAAVCTVDFDTPIEKIKKSFGLAAVAANAYIPEILDSVMIEKELIESVFEVEA